jgi:eukaryotic-like serine/threonine-protein kinase
MSGGDTKVMRGARDSSASKPAPAASVATKPSRTASEATEHVPDLPRFGRFRAAAELGAGAMGTVFRARDESLSRDVAIKALSAGGDAGIRERFLREARAIGAVHHSNILAIYDASVEGDTPYIVMELAAGGSLWDQMKSGPLHVETVRQVGIQIARALAAAHAANILHRDVKPANILATAPGTWKLADFGIARLPDSTLTVTGQFLGSPSYAAPESLQRGEFSPASDVYALGVTLYEALAGTPPHGDHDMRSLMRKLEEDPPPLHTRVSVPGPLGASIMAAVARDPARRPTAEQLANMLSAVEHVPFVPPVTATSLGISPVVLPRAASPVTLSAGPARAGTTGWTRTQKLVVAAVAVLALLVIIWRVRDGSAPSDNGSNARAADDEDNREPDEEQPTVLDQYGNPVDEETAKQILDEMNSRGRGRGKKHR